MTYGVFADRRSSVTGFSSGRAPVWISRQITASPTAKSAMSVTDGLRFVTDDLRFTLKTVGFRAFRVTDGLENRNR